MLKRKALRKILITTFSIITIFVICIVPGKVNNNFLNPKIDTIYVNNVGTNEIYLLGPNNYLIKTNAILNEESVVDKIKDIINYLTVDKSSKIPNGLSGLIPSNTILNSVLIENGIAILDFSKDLLNTTLDLEERIIEAIVYSIVNIDGIEGVIIKIDGNDLALLPQTKKVLPKVLNRNFGINKVFEISNINNVKKVTMYYIDNISNNNYYVPVTKYLNDDREKIKIIIDNLSSSYIYESSLISLLSQDTELINYEVENNIMNLNFNQNILSNNKLLEEIIYPISQSVFDNYDVDTVVFKINGNLVSEVSRCCGIKNNFDV